MGKRVGESQEAGYDRRKMEAMLRDEVARWRLMIEQSRDGIVILGGNGAVVESNRKYAEMLGYSMEEMHNLHVWDWDTNFSKDQLVQMITTVDDSGDHFETQQKRKDGQTIIIEVSTNGIVYHGQKLIFCVCRDVTERKKTEEERERLIKHLQEALAEVKDLRSILPICSFCKKVRDDKGYWEQVESYISKHTHVDLSHGICPECMDKYYPEINFEKSSPANDSDG